MATKTFKIGESCKGGVITAIATKTKVTIIAKEWDTTTGYNKGSDQSKAKEFNRIEVNPKGGNTPRRSVDDFLHELTTSYYAGQVMEWVEKHAKFENEFSW